jgi:hypothetical protein
MILAVLVTGCATQKILQASGGSKADGTVMLTYQVGPFEQPVVDYQQALLLAKEKCRAWGYKDAEPFGAEERTCLDGGCDFFRVDVPYQCK